MQRHKDWTWSYCLRERSKTKIAKKIAEKEWKRKRDSERKRERERERERERLWSCCLTRLSVVVACCFQLWDMKIKWYLSVSWFWLWEWFDNFKLPAFYSSSQSTDFLYEKEIWDKWLKSDLLVSRCLSGSWFISGGLDSIYTFHSLNWFFHPMKCRDTKTQ